MLQKTTRLWRIAPSKCTVNQDYAAWLGSINSVPRWKGEPPVVITIDLDYFADIIRKHKSKMSLIRT